MTEIQRRESASSGGTYIEAAAPMSWKDRAFSPNPYPLNAPTLEARGTASLHAAMSVLLLEGSTPSKSPNPSSAIVGATDYPNLYLLTHLADGGGWSTTINLINPSKYSARYQIALRDDTANPLVITSGGRTGSTFDGNLPPGASMTLTSSGPSTLNQGIVQVGTTSRLVASGIFTSHVSNRPDLEAAVPSFSNPAQSLLLPFDNQSGKATGVALANTGDSLATVNFTFRPEAGGVINGGSMSMAPRTKMEFNLTDKFSQAQGVRGTLVMSAAAPVLTALGLRFLSSGTFTSLPVYSTDSASAPLPRQVLSHVIDGGGWLSTITIVNLEPQPASYHLRTFDSSGNPLTLTLNGAMAATFSGSVPALSSVTLATPGTGSELLQGWADLTSTGRIRGQLLFDQLIPGQTVFEAAVPAIPEGLTALAMPYDNTNGLMTGLAVANSGDVDDEIVMSVRDELGTVVDAKKIRLGAGAKTAFVLADQLPRSVANRGLIVMSAPKSSISALALRFNGPAFTTLPIAPIDPTSGIPLSVETQPSVPKLPAAPAIQATAISSSQLRVTWSSSEAGIVRFRLERRSGSAGAFMEIAQPGASARAYDDGPLTPSALYTYRITVETGAGLSVYSNEASANTLQGLPSAPTRLQASATSSTEVSLSWTNNAADALAVRVEYRPASATTFIDNGAATSLTTTIVSGLQPNLIYYFRVRAQNSQGFSTYSNEVAAATLPPPTTVFLIHGLNQQPSDLYPLAMHLVSSFGLDPRRFRVNVAFNFSDCAQWTLLPCSQYCTIPDGASRLAKHIADANPPGDIILLGFSMGGLIARDLISNNRLILNGRRIALVTLGTPNLGYPHIASDDAIFCSSIVSAMDGDFRSKPGAILLSQYLLSLTNQWSNGGFPGATGTWLAASGRACSDGVRTDLLQWKTTGCPTQNPYSDGVVCEASASYGVSTSAETQPNYTWRDPSRVYKHSSSGLTALILCDTSGINYLPLWDPPPTGSLFATLVGVLKGL